LNGPDKAQVLGHQIMSSIMEGRNLIATMDCKSCHKEAEKSVGPSFKMVAEKYKDDAKSKTIWPIKL